MTAARCRRCARLSPNAFLCTHCQTQLRDWLTGLAHGTATNPRTGETRPAPGWLERLADTVHGHTRHGDSTRRSSDKGSPALCRLGVDGSFRGSPGQLMVYTHSVLTEWVRDLTTARGIPIPGAVRNAHAQTPASRIDDTREACRNALRLAQHVHVIAADPAAAVCHREIHQITKLIEHAINPPQPPRVLGPCPQPLDGTHDQACTKHHPHTCATALTAPRHATTTTCPTCKTEHNVDELERNALTGADEWWLTQKDVLAAMEALREPVPARTFRDWRVKRRLPTRLGDDGTPRYRITDVRALRNTTHRTNLA